MKTLYYIKTKSGEKLGPYKSKHEAEAQLSTHEGACTAEYYQLSKREHRIRNINPKLLSFVTVFYIAGMLVVISMGIFLIWFGYARNEEVKDWVATPASLSIESIEEAEHTYVALPIYSEKTLKGSFYYEVEGECYISEDMGLYTDDDINAFMNNEDGTYAVELETTCYVNPSNPEQAVLFKNPENSKQMYNMGAFVIGCGILVLISSIITGRRRKRLMSLSEEQIL